MLSACGNRGFSFGSEVVEEAIAQGAAESVAGNSLWALIPLPLFVCNATYCGWLLKRHGMGKLFFERGTRRYWVLAAVMGAFWIAGFAFCVP